MFSQKLFNLNSIDPSVSGFLTEILDEMVKENHVFLVRIQSWVKWSHHDGIKISFKSRNSGFFQDNLNKQ